MSDLQTLKYLLTRQTGLTIHEPATGKDTGYNACQFNLGDKSIVFRSSKTTPKKVGQFVAIWRRNDQGITQPYEATDPLDFMIISSRSGDKLGFFTFPKSVLVEKAIITSNNKIGKRGIRVYPPWEETTSRQARSTQDWQGRYFVMVDSDTHSTCLSVLLS